MTHRLRTYDQVPPGGFRYQQNGPKPRKFGPEPSIQNLSQQVASYRKANKLERPGIADVLIDVDRQNAARLGNDPRWTVPVDASSGTVSISPTSPVLGGSCAGCGGTVLN